MRHRAKSKVRVNAELLSTNNHLQNRLKWKLYGYEEDYLTAQFQQKQEMKELQVDFQIKYKMALKLLELFHMQEFALCTSVPFTQLLSQSGKRLKSATSDTYQPLRGKPQHQW